MLGLLDLVLAAHELELEAGVLVEADDAEDDEAGSHRQRQRDHRQLAVVSYG